MTIKDDVRVAATLPGQPRRVGRALAVITAALSIVAAAAHPTPAAEQPRRTLALVDFAVHAGAAEAARTAWLGSAVAELLQAKMQLFAGAGVVERQRLDLAFARAGASPGSAETDSPADLAIVPADVLIAGSVSVQAGQSAQRIKVMARAVETVTGRVVSHAAFSGQDDLAGLLSIVEKLAATLADGLGLTYTPAQLVYAEPSGLDTLQRYVEGRTHQREGRHEQAIEAFTEALERNGGRYFAAAHRSLGDAYQARIAAQQTAEAAKTREEYLARFRRDALQASGALFDLAVAYEANEFWKEAAQTFRDYITAVGAEGETVRWSFNLAGDLTGATLPQGISGRELGAYFSWTTAFKIRDGKLRFLHGDGNAFEVAVDVATGKLAGVVRVADPEVVRELTARRDAKPAHPPPSYRGTKGHALPLLARTERLLLYLESPVLILVDAASGEPVGKYRTDDGVRGRAIVDALFVEDDVIVVMGNQRPGTDGGRLQRLHLLTNAGTVVTPAAVARLHLSSALLHTDLEEARSQAARAEAELPRDPRVFLLRARLAAAGGNTRSAASHALQALLSGELTETERRTCEELIRSVSPSLRRIIPTIHRGGLSIVSLADPQTLVVRATAMNRTEHYLVDTVSGKSTLVPLPGLKPLQIEGRWLLAAGTKRGAPAVKVDLLTGEREQVAAPPRSTSNLAWTGNGVDVFFDGALPRLRRIQDREEARLVVVEKATRTVLGRRTVTLERERLMGAAADASSLAVTLVSWDDEAYFSGRGTWLRVEHFPLGDEGREWSYRAEGWMASNPVIENDRVSFLAHEGSVPPPEADRLSVLADGLPLTRVSLDKATGARLGGEPHATKEGRHRSTPSELFSLKRDPRSVWNVNIGLGGLFVPIAPRRVFAGRTDSLYDKNTLLHKEYWFYAPTQDPAEVETPTAAREYTLVRQPAPGLVYGETVYEALGSGFLAEKDFNGGDGIAAVQSVVR